MAAAAACLIPLASGTPNMANADSASDATSAASELDMKDVNGLMTGKSATTGSDGRSADITLGSYSTGSVQDVRGNVPTDAVIFLPYDSSMALPVDGSSTTLAESYDTEGTRWSAAVQAIDAYAQKLHDDGVKNNVVNRLSIIMYTGTDSGVADGATDFDSVLTYNTNSANQYSQVAFVGHGKTDMSDQSNVDLIKTRLGYCGDVSQSSAWSINGKTLKENPGCWFNAGTGDDAKLSEAYQNTSLNGGIPAINGYIRARSLGLFEMMYSTGSTIGGIDTSDFTGTGKATNKRNKVYINMIDGALGMDGTRGASSNFDEAVRQLNRVMGAPSVSETQYEDGVGPNPEGVLALHQYSLGLSSTYVKTDIDTSADETLYRPTSTSFDVVNIVSRFALGTSSEYPDATTLTDMGAKNPDGKAYTVSFTDADSLVSELTEVIGTSTTVSASLGAEASTSDYSSKYFSVPADASGVEVYEQSATAIASNGTVTWGDAVPAADTTVVSSTDADGNKGIKVTGFDYDANYVGEREDGSVGGKRLIVRFTETVGECFLGGNKVPTNTPATSGVSDSDGSLVSVFTTEDDQPTVDVALEDNCPATVADGKAYEGSSLDGALLGKLVTQDSGRVDSDDDYATLAYKVTRDGADLGTYDAASGTVSVTGEAAIKTPDDIELGLTPTITPVSSGTYDMASGTALTSTVKVLSPQATVRDSVVDAGADTTLDGNLSSWVWWNKTDGKLASDYGSMVLVSQKLVGQSGADGVDAPGAGADMLGTWSAGAVKPNPNPADATVHFEPTDNTDFTVSVGVMPEGGVASDVVEVAASDVTNPEDDVTQADIDASVKNDKNGAEAHAFTVYVKHSDPCYVGGDTKVNTEDCSSLGDGAVRDGSAYEYAVIGGGDDGKGDAGYTGLIDDTDTPVQPLLDANPDADLTWTFSDADGTLGSFTVPAGKTFAEGTWEWEPDASDYLAGVGEHKVSVALTASTRTDPSVAIHSWDATVSVYVPQVLVADSIIKLGNSASMSVNMVPGKNLNEQAGIDAALAEPNGVGWTSGVSEDPSTETNMLTSQPSTTLKAKELEGDDTNCSKVLDSTGSCDPTTSTTFKVQVDFTNPSDPSDRGPVSARLAQAATGFTGLTNGISAAQLASNSTDLVVINQHNAYPYNDPQGAFGDIIGVPLSTAENVLEQADGTKAAFTVYVYGKTVSSLPLTGGTGAGLAAVLTGLGTILFAGLLAGMAWWTRRSRNAAHAVRA